MATIEEHAEDGMLLLGAGCAILLQLADPVVAAGVAKHSDFARRPMARLHSTLGYVYAVTLGDEADAAAAAARVGAAHRPVAGASSPSRQRWVAATLYATAIRVHALLAPPLPPQDADLLYSRYARLGTRLGMPASAWPRDREAFAEYWEAALGSVRVGDDARRAAWQLLHPVAVPLWARALMPLVRLVTAGLLPASLRDAYGLRWSRARARRYRLAMRAFRVLRAVLPQRIRSFPSRYYLGRFAG